LDVLLPQETAAAMMQGGGPLDAAAIFEANVRDIGRSDAVVAVLDGADPDSGTCWECGYACGTGRPVVGVRTDFRSAGDDPGAPVNLMLSRSCAALILLPADRLGDVGWVIGQIAAAVRDCVPG
jgi:nucleoside 2-deoxyribosyltransferase